MSVTEMGQATRAEMGQGGDQGSTITHSQDKTVGSDGNIGSCGVRRVRRPEGFQKSRSRRQAAEAGIDQYTAGTLLGDRQDRVVGRCSVLVGCTFSWRGCNKYLEVYRAEWQPI